MAFELKPNMTTIKSLEFYTGERSVENSCHCVCFINWTWGDGKSNEWRLEQISYGFVFCLLFGLLLKVNKSLFTEINVLSVIQSNHSSLSPSLFLFICRIFFNWNNKTIVIVWDFPFFFFPCKCTNTIIERVKSDVIQNEEEKLTNICSDHLQVFEFDTEGTRKCAYATMMQCKLKVLDKYANIEIDWVSFCAVPTDRMVNT